MLTVQKKKKRKITSKLTNLQIYSGAAQPHGKEKLNSSMREILVRS